MAAAGESRLTDGGVEGDDGEFVGLGIEAVLCDGCLRWVGWVWCVELRPVGERLSWVYEGSCGVGVGCRVTRGGRERSAA